MHRLDTPPAWRGLLLLGLLLSVLACPSRSRAGTVILFVGDGTGLAQVAAARIASVGPDGTLALDQLDHTAVVKTHSASGLTTDSAAGASAWATGHKAINGALSVAADGKPVITIVEEANRAGYGTGLLTTTQLTHATPAAFAAHEADRGAQDSIALQMLQVQPHVMMGGGREYWLARQDSASKRKDDLDPLGAARQAGYPVALNRSQLLALAPSSHQRVLGLFCIGHMPYVYDRADSTLPSLAEMTDFAIRSLAGYDRGFLLLVEGGRIDHACHENDADREVWEAIALDQAVAVGLEYARHHDDAMVLFVADHETGGMSVANSLYDGFPQIPRHNGYPDRSLHMKETLGIGWASNGHSGIPVIAAAYGRHAQEVHGLLDNTDLHGIMARALGLGGHAAPPTRERPLSLPTR